MLCGSPSVNFCSFNDASGSYPAWHTKILNLLMNPSISPPSILIPWPNSAMAHSWDNVLLNFQLNTSPMLSHNQRSYSCVAVMDCSSQSLIEWTHSVSKKQHGPFVHVVHLGWSSVYPLVKLPCCQEFLSFLLVAIKYKWHISYQFVIMMWLSPGQLTTYWWQLRTSRASQESYSWESTPSTSSWRCSGLSRDGVSQRWEAPGGSEGEASAYPWMMRWVWLVWSHSAHSGCIIISCEHMTCCGVYSSDLGGDCFCSDSSTHLIILNVQGSCQVQNSWYCRCLWLCVWWFWYSDETCRVVVWVLGLGGCDGVVLWNCGTSLGAAADW